MGRLSLRDRKLAYAAGENPSNIENDAFSLTALSVNQAVIGPPSPLVVNFGAGLVVLTQRVYWVYVGYTQKTLVADYVQLIQTGTVAAGAQVCEVGLASAPSAPDGTAKTLTVLAVADSLPDLTTGVLTTGLLRQNVTAMGFTVTPCVHLWLACRFQMATTQPAFTALTGDWQIGQIQTTSSIATALAVGTSYTGVVPPASVSAAPGIHPYLRLVLSP